MSWQTRTICTFVAAIAPVEGSALMDAAMEIGASSVKRKQPAGERPVPEKVAADNAQVGSYEAFMASFGRQMSRPT